MGQEWSSARNTGTHKRERMRLCGLRTKHWAKKESKGLKKEREVKDRAKKKREEEKIRRKSSTVEEERWKERKENRTENLKLCVTTW